MTTEAVLLDIDGTLVDSNEFHVIAWHRAFKESGISITPQAIAKQIGKGADMLIPALAPHLPKAKSEAIAKQHSEIFKTEFLHRVKAFPDARELIEALHSNGCQIVLASSSDAQEVDHYVVLLGVKELLTATTTGDDVSRSKPAGDIFSAALRKTRAQSPGKAIAIGDTPYDAIAAAKSHIRTIALRSGGFSDAELLEGRPIAIYNDVADLLACLPASALWDSTRDIHENRLTQSLSR
jgi:HAD superfamily hydrolase (TIGR01509 family)